MKGHTKDECFKLIGYPDWFKCMKGKEGGKYAANMMKNGEETTGDNPLQELNEEAGSSQPIGESRLINTVV